MSFKWNLRMMMAKREIWTESELRRLIETKTGIKISPAEISRLLNDEQSEIKLVILDALCTALECDIDDILLQEVDENNNKIAK